MNLICFSIYAKMQGFIHECIIFKYKSSIDSADTMWVKNFAARALFHTISKINTFWCFTQKFKMATKNGGKEIFVKVVSRLSTYPVD